MVLDRIGTFYRLAKIGIAAARLKPDTRYTVADLIEQQVARRKSHPFVLFEGRSVSYDEFNADANRVAHWARSQGLQPGDVVALLMQNRPEYPAVWAGLAKVGVTTALLNTNLTGASLAHAIEAASTRRLIAGSECGDAVRGLGADAPQGLEAWIWRDPAEGNDADLEGGRDFDEALAGQPASNPDPALRSEVVYGDPVVYIYTSGTTGLPKAARMSHLRFATTGAVSEIAGFGKNDTMYCALPLYHSAGGAMCVTAVLRAGGTLALRRRFSASKFWDDVNESGATAFQYIGEFCRYLLHQPQHPKERDHRLRFCVGNGLRPDIWEEFQERFAIPKIVEFYGATEGNVALVNLDNTPGSVGKRPPAIIPAPKIIRYDVEGDEHVRDEDGLCIECGPDEVGELVGEIPADPNNPQGRFEGYTSKEATEKKVLRDVAKKGDTWFRTGDLLKMDAKGYYYFIDRIGDTFRWKGENVSTQEVAEALGVYPGVELCNVFGVEVAGTDGRAGMVALVMEPGKEFDGKSFYELVERSLPAYAAPVFVRLPSEAVVTGTFKLRKVELQKEGYDLDVVKDPLFIRDDRQKAYVPFTPERREELASGKLRV